MFGFGKKGDELAPERMKDRGIRCKLPPTECGLGNAACTLYGAVWFGGKCTEVCGEFKQGNFVGNFPMTSFDDEGNEIKLPMDEKLREVLDSGIQLFHIED